MAAGADSYITKPMDGDVLLRTISELLQANKVPPGE
jgi:DNA-binding response OmpR family regulator